MKNTINSGIYPAALTPFDKQGKVDVGALNALTQWYAEKGCRGIFAACLSSEIFGNETAEDMSLEDRVLITREIIKAAPSTVDVVTSGHVVLPTFKGIDELKAMADTGAKALVLMSNRLAKQKEGEETVRRNLYAIMEAIPDMDLGLYECPVPYVRLLSADLLNEMAHTGRFVFIKETSCTPSIINKKVDAVKGSRLQFFNANSVSLLDSVKHGAAGLCGVMANFHPDLYVKMLELLETDEEKAQQLQDELGVMSIIDYYSYPGSAKAYLSLEGLKFASFGKRISPNSEISEISMMEMQQRYNLTCRLREKWL